MDPEISFFFYLAAIICFVIAALGEGWRYGKRSRAGMKPALTLLPLGLALAFFPIMWDTAVAAW